MISLRLLLLSALVVCANCAYARTAVVVIAKETQISQLNSIELRKIFFAIPVTKRGYPIKAIRNRADPELDKIFLQTVVSMTEPDYDRRLLTLTTQNGRSRPDSVENADAILETLIQNPGVISVFWEDQLQPADLDHVEIVRTLWLSN